jgi:hypothetical protein
VIEGPLETPAMMKRNQAKGKRWAEPRNEEWRPHFDTFEEWGEVQDRKEARATATRLNDLYREILSNERPTLHRHYTDAECQYSYFNNPCVTDTSPSLLDVTDLLITIQAKVRADYHRSAPYTAKDKFVQSYLTRNMLFKLKPNSMVALAIRNTDALTDFVLWQTLFCLECQRAHHMRQGMRAGDLLPLIRKPFSELRNRDILVYHCSKTDDLGHGDKVGPYCACFFDILPDIEHTDDHTRSRETITIMDDARIPENTGNH